VDGKYGMWLGFFSSNGGTHKVVARKNRAHPMVGRGREGVAKKTSRNQARTESGAPTTDGRHSHKKQAKRHGKAAGAKQDLRAEKKRIAEVKQKKMIVKRDPGRT